jgi:hypothetical protein
MGGASGPGDGGTPESRPAGITRIGTVSIGWFEEVLYSNGEGSEKRELAGGRSRQSVNSPLMITMEIVANGSIKRRPENKTASAGGHFLHIQLSSRVRNRGNSAKL